MSKTNFKHAAWAIPYADLVTLLFAFFVVLYAVSSVNEGKYRALSSTLFTEFNGQKPPGAAPGSAPGAVLATRSYPGIATQSSAPDSHALFADTRHGHAQTGRGNRAGPG